MKYLYSLLKLYLAFITMISAHGWLDDQDKIYAKRALIKVKCPFNSKWNYKIKKELNDMKMKRGLGDDYVPLDLSKFYWKLIWERINVIWLNTELVWEGNWTKRNLLKL